MTSEDIALLQELYWRYKELALRAGASLALEAVSARLVDESQALVLESSRAFGSAPSGLEDQFAACCTASEKLFEVLVAGRDDSADAAFAELVREAREAHKRFRADVWKILPCEYAPCSATHIATTQIGGSGG